MYNPGEYECKIAQGVILIETADKIRKVTISDVVLLETVKSYTSLLLYTSDEYLTSDTLTSFDERLSFSFFRISRNVIINLSYVDMIQRKDTKHVVKLKIGKILEISRRRVKELIEHYKVFVQEE